MKVLGLPGQNPQTEGWMRALLDASVPAGATTVVQRYAFWDKGGEVDLDLELERAQRESPDLLVGKSLGSLIALTGHARGAFPTVTALVVIGLPIRAGTVDALGLLRRAAGAIPVLAIQKTNDPAGSSSAIRDAVGDDAGVTLAEMEGDDHAYREIDELTHIINPWIVDR